MSDNIKVINLNDFNEHSFITDIVYPMFDALIDTLDGNIQAVEDFWDAAHTQEGLSLKSQNQIFLTRYLQQLKIVSPTLELSESDVTGERDFSDFTAGLIKTLKLCDNTRPDVGTDQYIYTSCSFNSESSSVAPWLTPFTLVQPQLKGFYNQEPNFLDASAVVTVSKISQTSSPMFAIRDDYWKQVNWEVLFPDAASKSMKIKPYLEGVNSEGYGEVKYINVYKLIRLTDADKTCVNYNGVDGGSKDIFFRLGVAALPSEEGYRLAPAIFAAEEPHLDNTARSRQLDYFLNSITSQYTEQITNHYIQQGMLNWINL